MEELLTIENRGKFLVNTNYWDSQAAKLGYAFVSWNAGACRILVPDASLSMIDEMRTGHRAIIMAGKFEAEAVNSFTSELDARSLSLAQESGLTEHGFYGEGLDIVFDDGTNNPYSMLTRTEQADRRLPPSDHGSKMDMLIYTRDGVVHQLPCYYVVVDTIPSAIPTIIDLD